MVRIMARDIRPKDGSIMMYTSGCPKYQNRCWNRIGSPMLGVSSKVLAVLSSSIMVIPDPSIGKVRIEGTGEQKGI